MLTSVHQSGSPFSGDSKPLDYRQRLPALDGVRGIAILAVFFYHYAGGLAKTASSPALRLIGAMAGFGWSGVDIFFVLSGFLITGVLVDTQGDPEYFRNFYARRILRIFPIYYLFLAICTALALIQGVHLQWGHVWFLTYLGYPAALFWPTLVHGVAITHLWSLSAEEQFYMVWPFMIAKLRAPRRILFTCALVIGLALGFRALVFIRSAALDGWAYGSIFGRMDSLAFGAAAAVLMRSPFQPRIVKWAPVAGTVAVGSVILLCVARGTVTHSDPVILTAGLTLLGIGGSSLVILAASGGRVASLLSWKAFQTLGKYSYGLYLYHFPLSGLLSSGRTFVIRSTHSMIVGSVLFLIASLGINLVIAAASFHLIEKRMLRLKTRFSYTQSIPRIELAQSVDSSTYADRASPLPWL